MASVQPQLEALQKAMAQKGVDPVQMAQLTQAMNTLQSFIGKYQLNLLFHLIRELEKTHENDLTHRLIFVCIYYRSRT